MANRSIQIAIKAGVANHPSDPMRRRSRIASMVPRRWRHLDRKAMIGMALLVAAFLMGAILNKPTHLTDRTGYFPQCDDSISYLCIPTAYVTISLGFLGNFIINVTSAAVSAGLFVLGVILVRE